MYKCQCHVQSHLIAAGRMAIACMTDIVKESYKLFATSACRMKESRLVKWIIFWTTNGNGLQGRWAKTWSVNITDWYKLSLPAVDSLPMEENG